MDHLRKLRPNGRPRVTAVAMAAACALLLWSLPGAAWAAIPANAGTNSQKLLQYTNAERSARNLGGLSRSGSLDSTAQRWAEHLASEARMYHSSDPAQGTPYNWRAENLAYWEGHEPFAAEKIHSWWMNSTVHRNNIVHPGFTHVGFGMACQIHNGTPWVFAVAHFGGPSGPIENSGNGQASGGGSTAGMTCSAGGSPSQDSRPAADPPPPPQAPATSDRSQPASGTADQDEDKPVAKSPPANSSSPAAGPAQPSSAPARSSNPKDPDADEAGPQTTATAGPEGSPSPQSSPAGAADEPPQTTAAQLQSETLGAAQPTNAPLWIVGGLLACALAVSVRRRGRPQPKHSSPRRRLR